MSNAIPVRTQRTMETNPPARWSSSTLPAKDGSSVRRARSRQRLHRRFYGSNYPRPQAQLRNSKSKSRILTTCRTNSPTSMISRWLCSSKMVASRSQRKVLCAACSIKRIKSKRFRPKSIPGSTKLTPSPRTKPAYARIRRRSKGQRKKRLWFNATRGSSTSKKIA